MSVGSPQAEDLAGVDVDAQDATFVVNEHARHMELFQRNAKRR